MPLVFDEIVEAAKHFPIVFPASRAKTKPVALLGLRRARNHFVAEDGRWQAGYVPAFLRRYPFVFGRHGNAGARHLTVMLDRKAPHLDRSEGQPLFDRPAGSTTASGAPTAMSQTVQDAVAFLSRYQEAADQVTDRMAPLIEADVFVDRNLEMYVGTRRTNRITGIRVVDRERVAALDDATLGRWARSGLLEAVHAHWQSLTNFRQLTG
ncbi:hypothetical protein SADO_07662 [Salinisphaera dokdonensis CL-ES53]|uniref:SapC family protein n=1 Tax=Salinisphaera dokdonensis CL-ES53 TaxID=1304272 RepID=A0ABV2B0L5_9GAMM